MMARVDSLQRGVTSIKEIKKVFVRHNERHCTERIGWLHAAVLG
jgi:hypothetical protein